MNAQDLKENRSEIISRINEIADTTKMSEIMTAMLRLVEGEMNEASEPIALVDEVVVLLGYEKKGMSIQEIENINEKSIRNQRPSSMR